MKTILLTVAFALISALAFSQHTIEGELCHANVKFEFIGNYSLLKIQFEGCKPTTTLVKGSEEIDGVKIFYYLNEKNEIIKVAFADDYSFASSCNGKILCGGEWTRIYENGL